MGKLRLIASTALTNPGYQGGSTPANPDGFPNGEFYTLEVDPTNAARMIVEPGETTVVWYVAQDSTDGYTQAEIAAAEGVSAATITAAWIAGASNTAGWGKRSDLPLAWSVGGSADIGRTLYSARFNKAFTQVRSEWIMFKRGGVYPMARIESVMEGESPLHPGYYGSFGEGSRPQFNNAAVRTLGDNNPWNNVFQGIDFRATVQWNSGVQRIMFADCNFTTDRYGIVSQTGGQVTEYLTIFGCSFIDCVKATPENGVTWGSANDETSAAHFLDNIDHVLRWRCLYERNAWDPTYNVDGTTWNSGEFGLRPQSLNHDIYDQSGSNDYSDLEVVSCRATFDAGQWRSGNFANLLIRAEANMVDALGLGADNISYYNRVALLGRARKVNNITQTILGAQGNITADSIVNISGDGGYVSAKNMVAANLIDPNHVAHETTLADARWTKSPWIDNVTLGTGTTDPFNGREFLWKYDLTLFGWEGATTEINAAGISAANRNACTFGRWADAKQGVAAGTNTTDDACDYIRTLEDRALQAVPIWNYVAGLTGKGTIGHTAGAVARFSPDPDGDGWRTDTPDSWLINGTRGDFPVDGDDCDLNGNLAYSFMTWRFEDMDFGAGGGWRLYGGYISCTSMQESSEGSVELLGAAQFWINGASSADVVVTATGGRLGIGAAVSNVRGAFSGKSELLIDAGGSLTISTGDTITLTGGDVKAGFDGQSGTATLTVNGTLAFVASGGTIAEVREFRSGKYGLEVPTAGHTGQPLDPSVTSTVVLASGSEITVDTTGLTAGTYDLITCDSLTDNGATLPAGVAVVGNVLRLTVA